MNNNPNIMRDFAGEIQAHPVLGDVYQVARERAEIEVAIDRLFNAPMENDSESSESYS